MCVDNELEQLTRALATSPSQNFLATCEQSAHGGATVDLPTVPAHRMFPDPVEQLLRGHSSRSNNVCELSLCEHSANGSPKLQDVAPPAVERACGAGCGCQQCVWLDDIFASNRRWAKGLSRINPNFFSDMAHEDTPSFLWIGCADSRVVPNRVTGLQPGSLYMHRNVGNVAKPCDPNCMSALEYSVNSLEVQHVVVCGHYGCSAVSAAMKDATKTAGILNFWVSDIRQLRQQHQEELERMSRERQLARLCELNVVRQVQNICNSHVVRAAWERGQTLHVHGLIYDVNTGLLTRMVEPVSAADHPFAVQAAAEQLHHHTDTTAAFSAASAELLKAQGASSPASHVHLSDGPASAPSSPTLAAAAAAAAALALMQRPGTPSSPCGSHARSSASVAGEAAAVPGSEALQEELAWLRSSEACAVDAAQHLMEQTWALLKEKQEMSKKMAEQSETIKWLEERLHWLENESEHLKAAAPTQLIKRYQELRDLPSTSLTPDLLEELHLLQGLIALGVQIPTIDPASIPPALSTTMLWDKTHPLFAPWMDLHHPPVATSPRLNYTVEDFNARDAQDSQARATSPNRKLALKQKQADLSNAFQGDRPFTMSHKPPAPDSAPLAPAADTSVGPNDLAPVVTGKEAGLAGEEPDLWYLLGSYTPRQHQQDTPATLSSPSTHSFPNSSIISPRDSLSQDASSTQDVQSPHPTSPLPAPPTATTLDTPETSTDADTTTYPSDQTSSRTGDSTGSSALASLSAVSVTKESAVQTGLDLSPLSPTSVNEHTPFDFPSNATTPTLSVRTSASEFNWEMPAFLRERFASAQHSQTVVDLVQQSSATQASLSLPAYTQADVPARADAAVNSEGTQAVQAQPTNSTVAAQFSSAVNQTVQASTDVFNTHTLTTDSDDVHSTPPATPQPSTEPEDSHASIISPPFASVPNTSQTPLIADSTTSAITIAPSPLPRPPSFSSQFVTMEPPSISAADSSHSVNSLGPSPSGLQSPSAMPGSSISVSAPIRKAGVLPSLPPKPASSWGGSTGRKERRVVLKPGSQRGERTNNTRKEGRNSSRSRASSVLSTTSSRTDRSYSRVAPPTPSDLVAPPSPVSALCKMAEQMQELEEALWEDYETEPTGDTWQSASRAAKAGTKRAGNRAHGVVPGKGRVTFACPTAYGSLVSSASLGARRGKSTRAAAPSTQLAAARAHIQLMPYEQQQEQLMHAQQLQQQAQVQWQLQQQQEEPPQQGQLQQLQQAPMQEAQLQQQQQEPVQQQQKPPQHLKQLQQQQAAVMKGRSSGHQGSSDLRGGRPLQSISEDGQLQNPEELKQPEGQKGGGKDGARQGQRKRGPGGWLAAVGKTAVALAVGVVLKQHSLG